MIYLFKQLKSVWDGSDGSTVRAIATGGLHLTEAPITTGQNTAQQNHKPYVVLTVVSDTAEGTMTDNESIGTCFLQFSVYVGDYQLDTGWTIAQALKTLYDDIHGAFADSNGKIMAMRRMGFGMPVKDPDEGWLIAIEYKCVYTHTNT